MVQRTGFEPAKHYALGPHPSPFDHSGTSAWELGDRPRLFQNGEASEEDYRVANFDETFDDDRSVPSRPAGVPVLGNSPKLAITE